MSDVAARREAYAVRYFAETWAELMTGLPDSYDCHMTCAEANAAADLYRAIGDDGTAQAIIAAHIEHDDEQEAADGHQAVDVDPHARIDEPFAAQPQPAPELAAAMAESRRYREALHRAQETLDEGGTIGRRLSVTRSIVNAALEGK